MSSKPLGAGVGVALALAALSVAAVADDARAADATVASAVTPAPQVSATRPAGAAGPVVANVGSIAVTLDQLQRPLIEAYGLNILLNLVQLEVIKQHAARQNIVVTPADVARERELTIERMFKESNEKQLDKLSDLLEKNKNAEADALRAEIRKDNETAFEQFLTNQKLSRAEFDIVTETNTYLRKLAEPMLAGKITEENLREAFGALYGEKVKCRHIQCANLTEIQEAKRRLAAGEPFGKVAQDMSRNTSTGALGGSLPAFSLQMQGLPQNFKDAAFGLKKEGDLSEVVHADGNYHIILLEQRIPPKVIKFEHVRDSIREDLHNRAIEATIKQMRQELADQSLQGLAINDPLLKKQWDERLAKRDAQIKDREQIRKQLDREREQAATQPVTELKGIPASPSPAPAEPASSQIK